MVLHVIINNTDSEHQTVELFTDLRLMSERFQQLSDEGQVVSVTSAEL